MTGTTEKTKMEFNKIGMWDGHVVIKSDLFFFRVLRRPLTQRPREDEDLCQQNLICITWFVIFVN